MKAARLAAAIVTATLAMGALSQTAFAQGKSRDQVRNELIQAQHDGMLPVSKTQYPPNANLIERNKEVHASSRHAGEKSPAIDRHDGMTAQ
ncbi:DUF4148 domain-containing protein [Paraburkholderia sp. LEh10]|uniref:DUF4148 domain-containing protein n=1 Tax=Paraburkholderia sp. LEh10 TaxID=2821353 RepID=UPI001AE1171B|nr:DUF4148 domain-containing protein [Paraburkholderia sp. LEh10]MBP0595562.1 DUF4148 domain-containing protein [Paraburkholderia sp. LEh10]